ncbi:MAG TPA: HEAT repeat domain-containing protein [Polyangiaceae bacterium]|nr:HEAT repeat domain-containing protein [Polyangiaceae bacterium]
MRFRAIAMASERSNAVGTVELECAPTGLSLLYLGMAGFSAGYVPVTQTENEKLLVPWPQLSEASLDGEQLFLALDPKLSPLNRLCLVNFSSGNTAHHHKLYRRRLLVRLATVGAALSGAAIASAAAFRLAPGTTAIGALGIALATAVVLCALGVFADQLLKSGGLEGALAREAFVADLSGFLPNLARSPLSPPPATPKLGPMAIFQGLLPRTGAAIVMSLTAATLSFVLMMQWLLTTDHAHELASHAPRIADQRPFGASEPAVVAAVAPSAPTPTLSKPAASAPAAVVADAASACRCRRSDSLLWQDPIPQLSVLTMSKHTRRGREEEERKDKMYTEAVIGIVNNSSDPMRDIALSVEFFERDPPPSNKRYSTAIRPLFFEGPLLPGQAIKWDVEARGSEFDVHNALTGNVGLEGENAAPTNLLAELLHAHNRPVRMHGAMLLSFFGDPRAKDAILELREALREDEAPYLDRLLQAVAPIHVCALKVSEFGDSRTASACVFNSSKEPQKDLGLRLRALDGGALTENPSGAPPTVLAEATVPVPGTLAPDTGTRVNTDFALGGTKPVAFEAFSDRIDLLPR